MNALIRIQTPLRVEDIGNQGVTVRLAQITFDLRVDSAPEEWFVLAANLNDLLRMIGSQLEGKNPR